MVTQCAYGHEACAPPLSASSKITLAPALTKLERRVFVLSNQVASFMKPPHHQPLLRRVQGFEGSSYRLLPLRPACKSSLATILALSLHCERMSSSRVTPSPDHAHHPVYLSTAVPFGEATMFSTSTRASSSPTSTSFSILDPGWFFYTKRERRQY